MQEKASPAAEASGEVHRAAAQLEVYVEEARRAYGRIIPSDPGQVLSVRTFPVGPVGAFVPWNFPAGGPMRKIAAALAAGCPIVIKPSEETPGTTCLMARAFADAGLPPGVLNVLFGMPDEISRQVIASPVIRYVAFTGSVPVGKHVAGLAAAAMKASTMELGEHAPVIVCADTDVAAAVRACVAAKVANAGQVCTSPSRFLVDRRILPEFTGAFTAAMKAVAVGDGLGDGIQMGPLASARRRDSVHALVTDATGRGARLLLGGEPAAGPGFFCHGRTEPAGRHRAGRIAGRAALEAERRAVAARGHRARVRGLAPGAGRLARRRVDLGRVAPHVRHGHHRTGRDPAAHRGEREQLRLVRGRPGQAVHPGGADGNIITDGILLREGPDRYTLSGIPAAQSWVTYHGEQGGYDVSFATDPSSAFRGGADPGLFRYQVQGPLAAELVERAFGGPLPPARFFHSIPVSVAGRSLRALRHNMAGQDGYEFIGAWPDAAAVKDALMSAGEPLGLVHVGQYAYASASVESGWIPSPIPAVYTDPELLGYRRYLPLFGIEGQRPLNESFFSPDIEDYYCSPWELGYGRSISFNHDFIGRAALEKAKDDVRRTKVTLVFDAGDVRTVTGNPVAVQDLGLVLVPGGGGAVGVQDQGPALAVDGDLVVVPA
jgi:glycine cleavage system aminomethyltransferase T